MKRVLYVFKRKHDAKPVFLYTITIEIAANILGARDILTAAYADLEDADLLMIVREEYALKRGWIDKPSKIAKTGPISPVPTRRGESERDRERRRYEAHGVPPLETERDLDRRFGKSANADDPFELHNE